MRDHPYKAMHSQLETILIHIDAGFVFRFCRVESGLEVKWQCISHGACEYEIRHLLNTYWYQFVRVIMM